MAKQLTDKEKQEIRDKIDRLKHIKEPYVQVFQGISIFVVLMIFILGAMGNQADKIVDVSKYNFTAIENQTSNLSSITQGYIEPMKSLNVENFNSFINYSWIFVLSIYIFFIFFFLYGTKYEKYNKEIKKLYNQLIGLNLEEQKKVVAGMKETTLLWLAAGIGFLGNIAANFILDTSSKEARFAIGLVSFIGFFFLFWALSKGYGKIYFNKNKNG